MRWKMKPKPIRDDKRTICMFLWLPKKASDEWRWLEWVCVCQEYEDGWPLPELLFGGWRNIEWDLYYEEDK